MVFSNFYSLVGPGLCLDRNSLHYSYIFGNFHYATTDDEACGGWCAQHITNAFVGYEQAGNSTDTICRCLFSADGYPSPIPSYENPQESSQLSNGNLPGIGPIVSTGSFQSNRKCFRYIVSFAILVCTHQVVHLTQMTICLFIHSLECTYFCTYRGTCNSIPILSTNHCISYVGTYNSISVLSANHCIS